jgi:endonuclease/exonuclease/phosphatase family metal-dependent hydrolase
MKVLHRLPHSIFRNQITRNSLGLILTALLTISSAFGQSTPIRVVAANLSSGNLQSYLDEGERLLEGVKPDIILIQEFRIGASDSNSVVDTDAFVSRITDSSFDWMREPGGESIPNGIISRWPIVESGQITHDVADRDHAYARIDIPGDIDLWAVSVHLRTASASVRRQEAEDLITALQVLIPPNDYLIIGGDLNTNNRSEAALSELDDMVIVTGPYPVDQNGNGDTNAGRNSPYDWVLVDADLDAFNVATLISDGSSTSTYTNGLVLDSRVYTPLSEVSPVQFGDSGASMMQHMAVVRDFLVPATAQDFTVSANSVAFGTQDATSAPFDDSSISLLVSNSFQLNAVNFSGTNNSEFTLVSPDLSGGPVAINSNTTLQFRWNPPSNDSTMRNVVAAFTTNGDPSSFNITLTGTPSAGGTGGDGDPWINEIHYDNAGTETGFEFVEVAGPAGTDLTGWSLVAYNGSTGQSYDTVNLSGIIPDQSDCFGTLEFGFSQIQNGGPDGMALVDNMGTVIQFLSYEGSFTAGNGPASGMMSVDIGVEEVNTTLNSESLQLSGDGTEYADFTWQGPATATRGSVNTGQTFTNGCVIPVSLSGFVVE